ncbi:MAG: translation initiation factor IF-3, partial [Firmicutes bacterium]|nr:translation initiation factor IF-3 [Bacillota bacterium]
MRVNRQIRAREVRLVGPDGAQLGIMSLREALRLAEEQN